MKLRAPEGCASVCHDSRMFIVEADGSIEVRKDMVAELTAHGFTPWDEAAVPSREQDMTATIAQSEASALDIEAFNRAELFAFLRAHGLPGARHDTNAVLRTKAREAMRSR